MKVFFRFSPRSDYKSALQIYKTIEKIGHTNISDFAEKIDPSTFYVENEKLWEKRYKKSLKEIDSADVCIFESSIPSTAMGQLAQISVDKFKPTIILYTDGSKPYFFRGLAETEKRVQLLEYDHSNIKNVLEYAFNYAEEYLNTRFTLIFPPDIITHLNKIKGKGVSRSEYIRELIRKDMQI